MIWTNGEFSKILDEFAELTKKKKYERTPYEVWRQLKKAQKVHINFRENYIYADGISIAKMDYNQNSLAAFLYDYYFEKEEPDSMTSSNSITNIDMNAYCSASSSIAYGDTCLSSVGDCTGTTAISSNYTTYYDSITNISTAADTAYHSFENWVKEYVETEINKNKNTEKEEDNKMKGINFDFGPCGNTVRLSMYGLAVQNVANEWVSYNPASKEIINVDVFNIADGGKYMYKMPVAVSDVKVGDILIHNRVPMFVISVNDDGTFGVIDVRAGESKTILPQKSMFNFNFVTKVVSLFGAFTNAPTADQPFGNMLPFIMMEDSKDIDPMFIFMMMNQNGANIPNMFSNPMMMYFLMKDGKNSDMATMLMLSGLMNNQA